MSYEEFLDFHRTYYHPSNSYIYLYGDVDVRERLEWLDKEYLSKFEESVIDSEIEVQPVFEAPREVHRKYSISNTESEEENTYLSFNVSIATSLDVQLAHAFAIIEYALLSAPGHL